MLSEDEIDSYRKRLSIHREKVRNYLEQRAMHGRTYCPPVIISGIKEDRQHIQQIKALIRDSGYTVNDEPDDKDSDQVTKPDKNRKIFLARLKDETKQRQEDMLIDGHVFNLRFALRSTGRRSEKNKISAINERISYILSQLGHEMVIVGEAGTGKTASLIQLELDLVDYAEKETSFPIPVIIPLSLWSVWPKTSFQAWLEEALFQLYAIPRRIAKRWVAGFHILPLLDGLDEVDSQKRTDCISAINKYIYTYKEKKDSVITPIIVSCRETDYNNLPCKLDIGKVIEILELLDDQIDLLFPIDDSERKTLREALQSSKDLREFIKTPLALTFLLKTYKGISIDQLLDLNSNNDRYRYLFREYVVQMLERWRSIIDQDHHKSDSKSPSPYQTIRYLTLLAYHLDDNDIAIERLQPSFLSKQYWIKYTIIISSIITLITLFFGGWFNALFAGFGTTTSIYLLSGMGKMKIRLIIAPDDPFESVKSVVLFAQQIIRYAVLF